MSEHRIISKINRKWTIRILLRSLLIASLIAMPCYLLIDWVWSAVIFLSILLISWMASLKPSTLAIVNLLNQQLTNLEFSTALLLQAPNTNLERLQQNKIAKAIKELPQVHYPVSWTSCLHAAILGGLLTLAYFIPSKISQNELISNLEEANDQSIIATKVDSVKLTSFQVFVATPGYTKLGAYQAKSPNLDIPAGSRVIWQAAFEGSPAGVWIAFTSGDSIPLTPKNGNWSAQLNSQEQGFYTFNFIDESGASIHSPLYQFLITPDAPPEIEIVDMPQFQRLEYAPDIDIPIQAELVDDYGLTDAYLVATITKGSGESVLFREEKIKFSEIISGKQQTANLTMNTTDLGMEPGNELYFYVTAFDNHPEIQQSKTETYFFILEDTAEVEFSIAGGLGVDLMPDYFRSQLQIIIDTEKLLEDQPNLSEYEFNSTSNALGFDQKQLRLKYGQFIGEEEDSGLEIDQEPPPTDDHQHEETDPKAQVDVLDEFGHDTDHENEEGQLMDKGTWQHDEGHHHSDEIEGESEEDPLAEFLHNHENEETATFLFQTVKAKLRGALNEMWDAELYLRLYRPEESLPYQRKALKLLNEVKNHARIYVQRIGFDPPPINEADSRFSREVEDGYDRPFSQDQDLELVFPAIQTASMAIDNLILTGSNDNSISSQLTAAGNELSGLVLQGTGEYLDALTALQHLIRMEKFDQESFKALKEVKVILDEILKINLSPPSTKARQQNAIINSFVEELNKQVND